MTNFKTFLLLFKIKRDDYFLGYVIKMIFYIKQYYKYNIV